MSPNFSYINRELEPEIQKAFGNGKVIVIYGPRQAGKTTLIKKMVSRGKFLYLSCDEPRVRNQIAPDSLALKKLIVDFKTVVFDEAQYLENPGLVLKIAIDNFPQINFVASGSSSFDLANKLSEPLTGRHFKFHLFPISVGELKRCVSPIDLSVYLNEMLIYGGYPDVVRTLSNTSRANKLGMLTDSYLYKDILSFNLVKNNKKIRELLTLLAFQIGSEVSYHELGNALSLDKKTVENYLDLLEKTFVIFRLYAFSRNLRSELNRKVKIFFYDLGVRNAIINNFNPAERRDDMGKIFENFVVAEKVKINMNAALRSNMYFWRTYTGQEIDLVEERSGKLFGFEIKWKKEKFKAPKDFLKTYPASSVEIINQDNYLSFVV